MHYHLLIVVIARQLRSWIVALSPCFLDNTSAGFRGGLIERGDVVEFDLGVER